jgi:hypothetical protein
MSPKNVLSLGVVGAVLGLCGPAEAQISRVFVSVNGNDANSCANQATPCRTIGGGVTQVDANGEVIIVDTGSYAGGTITKAVKVNAAPGIVAFSGLPIVVNPGAGNTVVLRGLTIKSATPGSGIGVSHNSGNLMIENCVVDNWSEGVVSDAGPTAKFVLVRSITRNNGSEGFTIKSGIGTVDGLLSTNNSVGVAAQDSSNFGGLHGALTVSGSVIVQNSVRGVLQLGSSTVRLMGNSVIEGNGSDVFGSVTTGTLK